MLLNHILKTHKAQQTPNQIVSTTSAADELLKYAELYEKGLLTKEEFDLKKSELLSINSPIAEQPNDMEEISPIEENLKGKFCPNCGSEVDADSNFCTDCGTKL